MLLHMFPTALPTAAVCKPLPGHGTRDSPESGTACDNVCICVLQTMPGLLIIGALLSAKAGFQIYAIWHRVDRYYENKCASHTRCRISMQCAQSCLLSLHCPLSCLTSGCCIKLSFSGTGSSGRCSCSPSCWCALSHRCRQRRIHAALVPRLLCCWHRFFRHVLHGNRSAA